MIADLFLLTIGSFFVGIAQIFIKLTWHLPIEFTNALVQPFILLSSLNGILFFLGTAVLGLSTLLLCFTIIYFVGVLQWIWAYVPFFGKRNKLPGRRS